MKKVKLSTRAVEERVRRALANEGITLKKAKGSAVDQVGEYFGVDAAANHVAWTHNTLDQLAKDLKVLKAWETL